MKEKTPPVPHLPIRTHDETGRHRKRSTVALTGTDYIAPDWTPRL